MKIAIIGGGAAGIFCAANINSSESEIVVLESGFEFLRKVEQSGGGRCNITNAEPDIEKFIKNYPRGGGRLRKPLRRFGPAELEAWFAEQGVEFITEQDRRVFPKSEDSLEIVNCLKRFCQKKGVIFRMPFTAIGIEKRDDGFLILGRHGDSMVADKVVVAVGGKWNEELRASLETLGHTFVSPCPSLFPLKTNFTKLTALSGVNFKNAKLKYAPSKIEAEGDVVITHEGLSGPATLKFSALCAREFQALDYRATIEFAAVSNPDACKKFFAEARNLSPKKLVRNFYIPEIPKAYWCFAADRANIPQDRIWAQISSDEQKNFAQNLCALQVQITGRAVNSREFVTCGGISLNDINFSDMQSKKTEGLFFAGECLDIDAFTGGFNLQAAWTTGWIAAKAILE